MFKVYHTAWEIKRILVLKTRSAITREYFHSGFGRETEGRERYFNHWLARIKLLQMLQSKITKSTSFSRFFLGTRLLEIPRSCEDFVLTFISSDYFFEAKLFMSRLLLFLNILLPKYFLCLKTPIWSYCSALELPNHKEITTNWVSFVK